MSVFRAHPSALVASAGRGEREDLERFREVASRGALAAGGIILSSRHPTPELKGRADYVTEVDRAAEESVRSALAAETPDVPVMGEELGGRETDQYWLVDPLDGTVNFLLGFPIVAVSVALFQDGPDVHRELLSLARAQR